MRPRGAGPEPAPTTWARRHWKGDNHGCDARYVTAAAATTGQPGRKKRGDGKAATGFLAPSMLGLLAFTAFPIVASLIIGFYNWPVIGGHTFTGLKNYQTLLASKEFHTSIRNTFVFVLLYLPLNIVISLGLAGSGSVRRKSRPGVSTAPSSSSRP